MGEAVYLLARDRTLDLEVTLGRSGLRWVIKVCGQPVAVTIWRKGADKIASDIALALAHAILPTPEPDNG